MVRDLLRCASIIALLTIGTIAYAEPPTAAPATAPATSPADDKPHETVKVKRGKLNLNVTASGTFEPVDPFEVRIRPRAYQGELQVIAAVSPGATVAKGDTILQIDDVQIKRQLAGAENELAAARANFDRAHADVALGDAADALALKIQEQELANAINGLKWWEEVDGKQMVQAAEVAAQNMKDAVGDQEDELDQLRKMYKSEELTNETADIVVKRAVRQLKRTQVAAEMSDARAGKIKAHDYEFHHARVQNAVEQHTQALERLKVGQQQAKILRQTGLTGAKLALESADEKFANLKADFEQFTVKAPASMTVFYGQLTNGAWQNAPQRAIRAGDKVAPHQVIMSGCAPGELRVVADVPESKVLLIEAGQRARVTPTAMPHLSIEGKTGRPNRTVVPQTSNFQVPVEVASASPKLEPGMKASITIETGKADDVITVPLKAVRDSKVKVWRDDAEREVSVTIGRTDGENVEITQGLSEGDEVLKEFEK